MSGKRGMKHEEVDTVAKVVETAILLELRRRLAARVPVEVTARVLTRAVIEALKGVPRMVLREEATPAQVVEIPVLVHNRNHCPEPGCWSLRHEPGMLHWNGLGRFRSRGRFGKREYVEEWCNYARKRS